MRELVVLSGKGGTGKTSLTAAFASFAKNKILCDADVDAADLHLLTSPDIKQKQDFKGGGIAVINPNKCSECGICRQLCRFDAIKENYEVMEGECEGCGVCVDFCPEKAIDFPIQTCGEWYISDTRFGEMVHARLGIAEENSGKLVTLARQEAKKLSEKRNLDLIITDGPPGIGCPVIASLSGASAILIVTEPTVSGLHDMERVADLASHFNISGMICINKYDLNIEKALEIEEAGKKRNIPVVGKIPFDPIFTYAMVAGKTVCEYNDKSKTVKEIKAVWERIISSPAMNSKGILDFNNIIRR
ncbi:MAG: P-loop NTPase [Deltaproteobacteria bacterium]|nr:P-loop NTPase [Deltaproteobacteria bacterium]